MSQLPHPDIVSPSEWRAEIDALRVKEKELTRLGDEVNAARRRLPMMKMDKPYTFQSEDGEVSLLDLFEGRPQLITYHFMYGPEAENGCPGCSWVTDAMSHPGHLNARDVSLVLISRAPLETLLEFKKKMGWDFRWMSSLGSDFNYDVGATTEDGEQHMTSVFFRKGNDIFRTYYTDQRGVEHLGSHWTYLDLVPYGRQEPWEVSPEGWPKGEMYWPKRHTEYED